MQQCDFVQSNELFQRDLYGICPAKELGILVLPVFLSGSHLWRPWQAARSSPDVHMRRCDSSRLFCGLFKSDASKHDFPRQDRQPFVQQLRSARGRHRVRHRQSVKKSCFLRLSHRLHTVLVRHHGRICTLLCRQSVIGECAAEPHLFHSSHGDQDPVTCCRRCCRLFVPLMQGSSCYFCIGYSKGRSLAATSGPRRVCGCQEVSSQACRGVELFVFTRIGLAYAQDMTYLQSTATQSANLWKCRTIQGIPDRSLQLTWCLDSCFRVHPKHHLPHVCESQAIIFYDFFARDVGKYDPMLTCWQNRRG